jgi:hypothetical protein
MYEYKVLDFIYKEYRLLQHLQKKTVPQWPTEICWQEHKLLSVYACQWGQRVGTRKNEVPGPPGSGLGVGLLNPPLKILLLRNLHRWKKALEVVKIHKEL